MNATPMNKAQEPECASLRLRMAARALTGVYDEVFRPLGIKSTQFSLLSMIKRFGPITFQGLAEKMVLDQTTLPRSLRTLEKDGYIRIEPGEDRRQRLASLTSKGAALLEKAVPIWRMAQAQIREKFRGDRLDKLMNDLDQLRRAISE